MNADYVGTLGPFQVAPTLRTAGLHGRVWCMAVDFPESFEPFESFDGDLGTALNDTAWVSCPYCGEASVLLVDLVGGASQEYVQDCEVCCRPWFVRVQLDGEGYVAVAVTTLNDE